MAVGKQTEKSQEGETDLAPPPAVATVATVANPCCSLAFWLLVGVERGGGERWCWWDSQWCCKVREVGEDGSMKQRRDPDAIRKKRRLI